MNFVFELINKPHHNIQILTDLLEMEKPEILELSELYNVGKINISSIFYI
jgi:hypothetical protein